MPQPASSYATIMELLVTYHQSPSVALRNRLVRLNAGLVRKVVHRLVHQCNESFEDLEQIGYLGLIRAIERFNPKQGNAFSSFAVPYIRGEILHYLRDRGGAVKIPRRFQEMQKTAQRRRHQLTQDLGRTPTDQEMAAVLELSLEQWREMSLAWQNRSLISLDAAVSSPDDASALTLGEMLPDSHAEKLLRWEEDRAQLQQALHQLEASTRQVLELVYLKDMPRKAAAEMLGISPMTVSRRIQRGLNQLAAAVNPAMIAQG